MIDKAEPIIKDPDYGIKAQLDKGWFHPALDKDGGTSLFLPKPRGINNWTSEADRKQIKESLRKIPLKFFIKEYMVSGTAGAAYLIPDKISDVLYEATFATDIVPLCSPIYDTPGSTLKVDIVVDDSYVPHPYGYGGELPAETMQITQATITPQLYGVRPAITNTMIEDSQFDLMEAHLRKAAEAQGQFWSRKFLADLITCSDGDDTQNAYTSATADKTYLGDLIGAWGLNYEDGYISDVVVMAPAPFVDCLQDDTVSKYASEWHNRNANDPPLQRATFMGMAVVVVTKQDTSYTGTGYLYISSKWHSFVLNRQNAMATVRKRWLKIENYSDPVRDLVGAVISCRQDQVSVYNDASCEITEGS